MEFTTAKVELLEKLASVCLRWSTKHEEDHSAAAWEDQNNRTKLNVGGWFQVEPLNANSGVLHVLQGSFGIPPLSRPLRWPYHCFYIDRLYRDDLQKLKSTRGEK